MKLLATRIFIRTSRSDGFGAIEATRTSKLPPFSGSVFKINGDYYEKITVQRGTDICDIKRGRESLTDKGCRRKAGISSVTFYKCGHSILSVMISQITISFLVLAVIDDYSRANPNRTALVLALTVASESNASMKQCSHHCRMPVITSHSKRTITM